MTWPSAGVRVKGFPPGESDTVPVLTVAVPFTVQSVIVEFVVTGSGSAIAAVITIVEQVPASTAILNALDIERVLRAIFDDETIEFVCITCKPLS